MLLMIMIDGFMDALEQTYSFLGEIPAAGSPRVREAEVLPAIFSRRVEPSSRSFVTTTKPRPSLNHNLKSMPLMLTANNYAGTSN